MVDKLSAQQKEEFEQAFNVFRDDEGNIPNDKLYHIMKDLGVTIPDAELQMMIQDVDLDDNGSIDLGEFMAMMASHLGLEEPDESKEAFKCMDSETQGQIKTEDMREVIAGLREAIGLSDEQVKNIFLELDPDNVGTVDFRRYKRVFFNF